MDSSILEVKSAVLHTYESGPLTVEGGAYFSPEAYLRTNAQLDRLQAIEAPLSHLVPALVLGAGLFGLAAGYWLARRDED